MTGIVRWEERGTANFDTRRPREHLMMRREVGPNMIYRPDRTIVAEMGLYTLKGRHAGRFAAEMRIAH